MNDLDPGLATQPFIKEIFWKPLCNIVKHNVTCDIYSQWFYVQGSLAPLSELMDKHWEHDAQFVKHFKQPCWPITRHSAAPSHGHCPCRLSHICRVGFKKNFRTKNCDGPIAHCTNTPMVLFHYDFNVSDCLFEFYCQNTWCQDQAIKSFSSSHGCRRQPGLQNCGVVWRSTQFEGELSTHRDWNWWQLLSDCVTQRTNGAWFIETISRINTKQAFPHIIWSVISWAELLENKWTWGLWWTCSSYKPFAAPSEEYQNIRDCTSCSFQKCSHCFLNITLYFCLLSFARSTVHVSRTSLQKCNTQTDPQVCIGCSFLICKHGQN